MKNEEQARTLFGISFSERPRWKQFLICSSGFFFGYVVNGICEEHVYNMLQFNYGWYFTFAQGWVYIFLIYLQGFTPKQMVNPWKTYVKRSVVLMGSNGLTKGSLAFLNYPAQLMFKTTKDCAVVLLFALLPVLGGTSGVLQGAISMTKSLVVLIAFLAVLSISSRTYVPWFLKLMISLSSQTNELYQLASVAFCLIVAWVCLLSIV